MMKFIEGDYWINPEQNEGAPSKVSFAQSLNNKHKKRYIINFA